MASMSASSTTSNGANLRGRFAIMTTLVLLWGFMPLFNEILTSGFKEAFTLNCFQGMLVPFAFIGACLIIPATTCHPIAKMGCQNGVGTSLLMSAAGGVLFLQAGEMKSPIRRSGT